MLTASDWMLVVLQVMLGLPDLQEAQARAQNATESPSPS